MKQQQFGRYQLLELLGKGGMGQVFRAYDTTTDRVVALKVLPPHLAEDPVFQQRFRREAHAAAALNEPHVVPIHGFGEIDGQLYLDMRLIEGVDLGTALDEADGPFTPLRAVTIIEQVAAALDAAHEVELVHRDVKPSNIFVAARDFVYLIDFGIARSTTQTGLTTAGSTLGTMAYMAPERFKNGRTDPRSDIYALTCVLHECLTGERPYAGESLEQQISGHLVEPPPKPSTMNPAVPKAFDDIIAKGMAKDPDKRYQTASALAEAARSALPTGPVRRRHRVAKPPARAAVPPSGGKRRKVHAADPDPRRRVVLAALASIAVLVLGGGFFAAWQLRSDTTDSASNESPGTGTGTVGVPTAAAPLPIDPAALVAQLPESIRAAGQLVIGVDAPYPPAEDFDVDGNLIGFDVELMNAVAATLRLNIDFRQTPFETIIPSVSAGAFDVGMSSITDTVDRQASVDFVNYFRAGTQWAQRIGGAVNPDNACGLRVSVDSESLQHTEELPNRNAACVDAGNAPIEIVAFDDQSQATNALISGEVDAMSADSPVTGFAVNNNPGVLELAGGIVDPAPYGWAVAKGSPLIDVLVHTLKHLMQSGQYYSILSKWGVQSGAITGPTVNAGR